MPTIAHINTTAGTGTVGLWIDTLATATSKMGWGSAIIAGSGTNVQGHHIVKPLWRRYANAISHRLNGDDGRHDTRTAKRAIQALRQLQPDIVHIHNLHGYYMDIVTLCDYLNDAKIPVVITMHDAWLLTGRCAIPGQCPRWRFRTCADCEYPAKYPAVRHGRLRKCAPFNKTEIIGRLNAHIVCPSESLAEMVSQSGLAHLPVSLIPHGIDTDIFHPGATRQPDTTHLHISAVSRVWNEDKGADLLMDVAEKMPASWHLTVGGSFPKSLRPKWTKGTNKIHFTDRILSADEVANLYRSSDIVLSPSRGESFGLTLSESASCGTPVIANSEATPKAHLPKSCGRYTPFSYPDAVIDAIRKTAGQTVRAQNIRTFHAMTEDYIRLYKQIVETNRPAVN